MLYFTIYNNLVYITMLLTLYFVTIEKKTDCFWTRNGCGDTVHLYMVCKILASPKLQITVFTNLSVLLHCVKFYFAKTDEPTLLALSSVLQFLCLFRK